MSSGADRKSFPNQCDSASITLKKAGSVNWLQWLRCLLLYVPCPSSVRSFRVTAQPGAEKRGLKLKL